MATTWNPADKASSISLSGGNNTATGGSGGDQCARSVLSLPAGKFYLEVTVVTRVSSVDLGIGLASELHPLDNFLGLDYSIGNYAHIGSWAYNNGYDGDTPGYTGSNVVCFAIDTTGGAKKIATRTNNGTWNGNGGVADPAAGTNMQPFTAMVGTSAYLVVALGNGDVVTLKTATADWTYAAPSGFGELGASSGSSVTPGAGSLAYTGYAPTLLRPSAVAPPKGSLAYTGRTPTLISASAVAPAAGALAYTGYAPTTGTSSSVSPGTGALAYAGYAPTLLVPSRVAPAKGAIAYTGYAPTLLMGSAVAPAKGAITYSGHAPTTTNSGFAVRPGKGSLTYRGFAPTVLGLPQAVLLIPPMQNLDLVRQRANSIFETLQRGMAGAAAALPLAADHSEGALFADMATKKLYQVQQGAWVELFAKSLVMASASGSNSVSTGGVVPFPTEDFDRLGEYDASAYTFTPRFPGVYRVHAVARSQSLAAGKYIALQVVVNGSILARGPQEFNDQGSARDTVCDLDRIMSLAAGDVVAVGFATDTGGAVPISNTSVFSYLEIQQL